MTITFYQCSSEEIQVDKSLTTLCSLSGTLRDSCSILEPTIMVEWVNAPSFVNYMYIEEFGRYYFIRDIVSIKNGVWLFTGHVDVLSTYKTAIRNCGAWLARQESAYNLYLDDDKFLINAQRQYWTKAFPNRVTGASEGASFVLTVAGGPK